MAFHRVPMPLAAASSSKQVSAMTMSASAVVTALGTLTVSRCGASRKMMSRPWSQAATTWRK